MAVTVGDITTKLPQFCGVSNDLIQLALDMAESCINREQWGENRADLATLFLTGHNLILLQQGDGMASGAKTAESEGQISASYAVSTEASDSVYGSTAYGRQYLELRRTAFPCRCTP